MARFAKGNRALAISDRSGAAFPYKEMVKEWTGALVHNSEFEPKQPQLEPHPVGADPQGLKNARPARTEFPVQDILPVKYLVLEILFLQVLHFLILVDLLLQDVALIVVA